MRSFYIDQTSIGFVDHAMLEPMTQIRGISEQLSKLMDGRELNAVGDRWFVENGMTNLMIFRHYLTAWLAQRDDIKKDMYIVVRSMKPSSEGLPIEIYCFTSSILWVDYENTQSTIFEYIYAIANVFSLRIYQRPSGSDLSFLAQERQQPATHNEAQT